MPNFFCTLPFSQPSWNTVYARLAFTARVHGSRSRLAFTARVHGSRSRLAFTARVHGSRSWLAFTARVHGSRSRSVFSLWLTIVRLASNTVALNAKRRAATVQVNRRTLLSRVHTVNWFRTKSSNSVQR